MPDIAQILDAQHEVYTANVEAWAREERRFHGGYPMLVELERFTNETDASYQSRQRQSPLLNFGRIQAGIIVGHLNEVAPLPNYGTAGEVRERKAIPAGRQTRAERFHYNANGVGTNGLSFTALASGIQMRSLATGFRWTLVEMPRRPDNRSDNAPITEQDVQNGFRPFLVEYSPRVVPMWDPEDGRFNWAVIRVPWRPDGLWTPGMTRRGYYLLVRRNYDGLGDEFAGGGWWLFDPDKKLARNGTWDRTKGEMPLTMFMSDESEGTEDHPSVATMPLMELNQLASGLMNRISERNWNARNASKSQKHVLGAEPKSFNTMVEHALAGSYYIPVEGAATPDGKWLIPQIYDGASGAVESSVYATIITSTIAEAHELMVRQVTSTPESSGESKKSGFNEATSPMLSGLATRRETWENTVIPWVEMRYGAPEPSGFVQWPTEFDLTPVVQKIDRAVERMMKIGARSPTLEARMVEAAAVDDGVWPTKEAEAVTVRDELATSLKALRPEQTASVQQLTASGGTLEGALGSVGAPEDQITPLVGGGPNGSPDQTNPDAQVVTAAQDPNATDTGTAAPAPVFGINAPSNPSDGNLAGNRGAGPSESQRPNVGGPVATIADQRGDIQSPSAGSVPDVDLTPVTDRLDALTEQIAALVSALANKPAAPPAQQAPMVIAIPQPVPLGKRIVMQTESGAPITIDVQSVPPAENGADPNTRSA